MHIKIRSQSASLRFATLLAVSASALCACGGGGGGAPAPAAPPPAPPSSGGTGSGWLPGVFQPSTSFAAQCAVPRTGTDPTTGSAYADVQGSVVAEKNWLRSWTHELYLWYQEVQDVDPGGQLTAAAYFDLMKTFSAKDRFHFTYPTSEWAALSQSGVDVDYGAQWIISGNPPARQMVVAYTHPSSPAAVHGLGRGTKVLEIDGVSIATATSQSEIALLNQALAPRQAGEIHQFLVEQPGMGSRIESLQAATITMDPVQHVQAIPTPLGPVGYLLFTDHIATAESELVEAIEALRAENITDLVLDLRYNGGGYLAIASQLAYMIAGPARTGGLTFEELRFNDKHPATNPITGQPLAPLPFADITLGLSSNAGQPLPTLDLQRVFVLTGGGTCSASESIINSLRGIGFDVIQIGTATCGKPYGFFPADNCGTTYFSIQFQGVNARGFGDYGDGFTPSTAFDDGARLPGCRVDDDLSHALGDPLEAQLAAALAYREGGGCPAPGAVTAAPLSKVTAGAEPAADAIVPKSPWLTNRVLTAP